MASHPALHTAATAPMAGMSPERQQDTAQCWFVSILPWASEMKDYIPVHWQLTAMWGRCRKARGLLQTQLEIFLPRSPLVGSKSWSNKWSAEKGMVGIAGVQNM